MTAKPPSGALCNFAPLQINEDSEKGMQSLKKAEEYLEMFDFSVEKHVRTGDPKEIILKTAKELQNCGVVMGAFSHGEISDFFFGSCARHFLEDGTFPLFLYH